MNTVIAAHQPVTARLVAVVRGHRMSQSAHVCVCVAVSCRRHQGATAPRHCPTQRYPESVTETETPSPGGHSHNVPTVWGRPGARAAPHTVGTARRWRCHRRAPADRARAAGSRHADRRRAVPRRRGVACGVPCLRDAQTRPGRRGRCTRCERRRYPARGRRQPRPGCPRRARVRVRCSSPAAPSGSGGCSQYRVEAT